MKEFDILLDDGLLYGRRHLALLQTQRLKYELAKKPPYFAIRHANFLTKNEICSDKRNISLLV
jgi:hypothetical protein